MPASYGQNPAPQGGVTPLPPVQGPTGQLRGSINLQGGIAPRPPVKGGDSAKVPNPQLVTGQEADSKLGLFLDFNSVEVPQPIRGSRGSTDPGPREFSCPPQPASRVKKKERKNKNKKRGIVGILLQKLRLTAVAKLPI